MLRYWKETALVALAFFLMASCADRDRALVAKGKAEQAAAESAVRIKVLDSTIVLQRAVLARVGETLSAQADTVERVITKLVHDTLPARVVYLPEDSSHTHPMVPLTPEKVTEYHQLESTCGRLVSTCRVFHDSAYAAFATYEKRLKEKPAAIEIKTSCMKPTLTGVVLGAAAGFAIGERR